MTSHDIAPSENDPVEFYATNFWHQYCCDIAQLGAAANFGDRAHRQIWRPNVNNNIYILTHEYSSTGFE